MSLYSPSGVTLIQGSWAECPRVSRRELIITSIGMDKDMFQTRTAHLEPSTTSTTANALLLAALVCVCFIGCDRKPGTDTDIDSAATKYMLVSEPANALTPTEVKEAFESSETESMPVLIAGRIGTADSPDVAFVAGEATFLMTQLPDEEHAGGDPEHASTCPFCKRKLANAPQVMVRFVDDQGDPIKQGAAELLHLQKGDAVVIKGNAVFLEATGMIEVTAEGIYKRPKE